MKIVIMREKETWFALVVENSGDEHELTRSDEYPDLLEKINSMAPDAPVEFHDDLMIKIGYYGSEEGDYLIGDLDEYDIPDEYDSDDIHMVGSEYKLYAIMENETWNEDLKSFDDETATYDDLKAEIIAKAQRLEIDTRRLVFPYQD